jgi:hypothetical protein
MKIIRHEKLPSQKWLYNPNTCHGNQEERRKREEGPKVKPHQGMH